MKKRQSRKLTKWEIALQAECDKLRAQIMHQGATLRAVDEKASACADAIKGVPITVRDQFDQCINTHPKTRGLAEGHTGSIISPFTRERLLRVRDAVKRGRKTEALALFDDWFSKLRQPEPRP